MANQRHQFKSDWPIPEDFMLELGRMTTVWAGLENGLLLYISRLAGYDALIDPRAAILLAHTSFQQRIEKLESLCELLSTNFPHLNDYKKAIRKLELAQKARNKYSHNPITYNEKTTELNVSRYSARKELKVVTEVVELKDIKEATAKIHEASCALHSLFTQKELEPLWDRK